MPSQRCALTAVQEISVLIRGSRDISETMRNVDIYNQGK
jgi:hypothetical protein